MPEAAVDKYNRAVARKNDVGLPGQTATVKAVAEADTVQEAANDELGFGIPPADTRHHAAAGGCVHNVRHGAWMMLSAPTSY